MASIGTNIRNLRERSGLSQEQLGTLIGKTRSAVSQYESDKIVPRMGVIEDLARVLMADKSEILDTGDKPGKLAPDERDLLAVYRSLSQWQKSLVLDHAKMVMQYGHK